MHDVVDGGFLPKFDLQRGSRLHLSLGLFSVNARAAGSTQNSVYQPAARLRAGTVEIAISFRPGFFFWNASGVLAGGELAVLPDPASYRLAGMDAKLLSGAMSWSKRTSCACVRAPLQR